MADQVTPEAFDFWKFISGFFPVTPVKTAKLVFYICLVVIGLFIYHKFFGYKPSATATTTNGNVTINQCPKEQFFVIKVGPLKLGI